MKKSTPKSKAVSAPWKEDDYPSPSGVKHFDRLDEDEKFAQSDNYILPTNFAFSPVFANVTKMLEERHHTFDLKYDDFSQRVFFRGKEIKDEDIREIAEWVQRRRCTASIAVIREAVFRVAEVNRFHQVKDYLEPLVWDQTNRLETFLIEVARVEDSILNRSISAKWLIQAVARIYNPGCQADATLILEGAQGHGKSSFLRALFGAQWFTDYLPDVEKADAMIQLQGVWLVELAELATLSKSESASIKRFLTSRSDRFRKPYGHVTTDHPRSSVFAGTVNPGAGGYLKDETGARRFWPITISERIDIARTAALRDQIWAEAVHRYKAGEEWHITDLTLLSGLEQLQNDRYAGDPWLPTIQVYVESYNYVSSSEILESALGIKEVGRWSTADYQRVAKCLSHLGWFRYQARAHGEKEYRYRRVGSPVPERKEISKAIQFPEQSVEQLAAEFGLRCEGEGPPKRQKARKR
jgi:putative DNA primase/helicase